MSKKCAHCGRQIVNYKESNNYVVGGEFTIRLVGDQYCCHECNDFDNNGLLPNDPEYILNDKEG